MRTFVADLSYGLRLLRKSPGFAALTIGTLALGIGASTAVFSVVDGVLLKRLPVKDQERLLVVWTSKPDQGMSHWALSYAQFEEMRMRLRTVSGAAAHPYAGTLPAIVRLDDGSAMPLRRTAVTGDWFGVLGVPARAGRMLEPADDHPGAPRVVVLSNAVATRVYGSAEQAIDRRLRIQETVFTVVGVTPAEFDFPRTAEAWVPAVSFKDSPYVAWDLVVRVAPAFTVEQTVADLGAVLSTLTADPKTLGRIEKTQVIRAQTMSENVVGGVRRTLLMLAGAVGLMLLVAGVNVANLLIARGIARRRELSVRVAVGASRGRVIRQIATEAVVLAALGAAVGIVLAVIALHALLALAPPELPRVVEIGIDRRALAFSVAMAALLAVVFGTVPPLYSARIEPADALRARDDGAASKGPTHALRHALVVGQIAATMTVMSTTALLVASVDRMQRLDVGFAARDLFLAEIAIPPSRYPEPADMQRGMMRLAEHTAALSGITGATAVTMAPFAGTEGVDATVFGEGQAMADGATPIASYEGVDASYFSTVRIPILRGRAIDTRDRAGSDPVVVVNETFARLFWPGRDPIGRRIKWGSSTSESAYLTVVGLAADTRYRELTNVRPSVYVPYAHGIPVSPGYLAVRGDSAAAVAGAVRQALAEREPGAAIVSIAAMPHLLATPLARPRFQAALVSCFAALALLLSIVGTYGMLSFLVRQRRHEIGIRIALGAAPSHVRALVLRQGLIHGVSGVAIGAALALAVARFVQPVLFGVSATDSLVLLMTAVCLFAAVLAATALPTRAAVRTDPLLVLRGE